MKTFIQVLEGTSYTEAQVVALIDAPSVVQAVRGALAAFFQAAPWLATPAANGKARKGTTYMRKYGKTLKALAAEVGLHPSVVATRVRRGWSMKEALKTPARPRAPNGAKAAKRTKRALDKPTAAA